MKFLFLLFFAIQGYSQEVAPLNNIHQVDSVLNSKKGKIILVNFWATWCIPCVKEFPDLVRLNNEYKDKNVEVIFISADFPEEINSKVIPFLKENNVSDITFYNNVDKVEDLINYFDKNWGGSIPSTYIYDKAGNKIAGFDNIRSYEEFESEIKKALIN